MIFKEKKHVFYYNYSQKIHSGLDLPLQLEKNGTISNENDFSLCCAMMIDSVEGLYSNISYFESKVTEIGNEKFSAELWTSLKLIKTKLQISSSEIADVQLYDFFNRTLQKLARVVGMMADYRFSQKDIELSSILKLQTRHFKDYDDFLQSLRAKEKIKNLELNNTAKRLQKFIRSKVSGWYRLMRNIFDRKLKKDLKKRTSTIK